jgi:hypothetical protein
LCEEKGEKMTKKNICEVDHCGDEVHALGMCVACYQHAYYWKRKSLKEEHAYLKQQARTQARCERMEAKSKVRIASKKRKRKAA